jgi:predicted metal-dependent phosphoesterase TrpH
MRFNQVMRCDLHVHTRYSGALDVPGLSRIGRESYSEPWEVYETAKRRGMDLVTITDHDTVDGALMLAHVPDFIVGEEVTCHLPGDRVIHLGVWDLDARHHEAIAARQRDPEGLFAYLAEQRLPACVNHLFSPLTGPRRSEDFDRALDAVALVETQNGMMPAATNEYARLAARALGRGTVGGSDSHTLGAVARSFTVVPRARNRAEFLAGLRAGLTAPAGDSGGFWRLTAEAMRVFLAAYRESAADALASPLGALRFALLAPAIHIAGLIPLFTFTAYLRELVRGQAHYETWEARRARGRTGLHGGLTTLAVGGEP